VVLVFSYFFAVDAGAGGAGFFLFFC